MDKILHDPKDPKLWELWYIPYYGSCRILSISRKVVVAGRVLGGSWDLVSRVISTLIGVISNYNCSYLPCNPTY